MKRCWIGVLGFLCVFIIFTSVFIETSYAQEAAPDVGITYYSTRPNPFNLHPDFRPTSVTISGNVFNVGHGGAGAFNVRVYLVKDTCVGIICPQIFGFIPPNTMPENPTNAWAILPDPEHSNKVIHLGSKFVASLTSLEECELIVFCVQTFVINATFPLSWPDGSPMNIGTHEIVIIAEPTPEEPRETIDDNISENPFTVINNASGLTCPPPGCIGTSSGTSFRAIPTSDTTITVALEGGATQQSTDRFELCVQEKVDSSCPTNTPGLPFFETNGNLITRVGDLSPGKIYFFRYRQLGCSVCTASWSTIYTWGTTPTRLSNPFPGDGVKGVPKDVSLSWQGGAIPGYQVDYVLYWGPVGGPQNAITRNNNSYTLAGLKEGVTYTWRVEASSGPDLRAKVKGPTWRFTVTGPPNVPNKPAPGVGAGMVSSSQVLLGWFGGSPNPNDQITYDVYLGKEVVNKCPLRDSDRQCRPVYTRTSTDELVTTPVGFIGLTDTSTYYWKVVAKSGTHTVEGPVWWFFTEGNTYQISAPPGGSKLFPKVDEGTGSYLVVWQELGPSGYYEIRGSSVLNNGTILVENIPINVNGTTNLTNKMAPAVAFGGNFLVVWWDNRNGTHADVFGALVRSDGLIIKNNILISTAGSKTAFQNFSQMSPDVSWDPVTGHYFVAWMDNRSGTNFDIYGARVDGFTGDVLDLNGILISNATRPGGAVATQQYPIVEGGGGVFWVTWEDGRNFGTHIYGARVRASDGALLDPNGISVSLPGTGRFAASAFDGQNFLTVWQDSRSNIGNGWNIMGTRIRASDGAVLDFSSTHIRIADAPGQQMAPAVTYGNSKFFVVWEDLRDHVFCTAEDNSCDWNPYAAWVRLDGVVLDRLNISLTKRAGAQRRPAVAFDIYSSSYFAVWEHWEAWPSSAQIWGQGRGTNFFKPGLGDDLTPPSVPADLRASAASTTQIDLSWSASIDNVDGVGVDRYSIYRCIGVTQSCTAVGSSYRGDSVNILFSDTGLAPNTAYTYTVISIDGDGNRSAAASPASATTLSNIDLMASSVGAPASARAGNTLTVTHSLKNNGSGNSGGFVVKYYLASTDPVTEGTLFSTRSFPSGLAAGATFTESFSVTIPTGTAEGGYSLAAVVDGDSQVNESDEENNLLSLPMSIDNTPPIINLTAPGSGVVCCTVSVTANVTDNFQISSVVFLLDETPVFPDADGSDGWNWNWNTLTATDGSHTLTAKAVDAAGNSTLSAAVTVQVYNPPVAPTGLTVADVAGDQGGALQLSWTVSASTDITQQRIYRGTSSSGPYSLVATITDNTTSTYTNTSLTNGTTYYYVVRAFDGSTESDNSNVGSATPFDNLAPTISNVAAVSITASGSTITWTTNEASDTQVEYGTTTSYGSSTTLNTSMVTSHNATLSGLSASTLYHYRVKSKDAAGNLATSADFTLTTSANPVLTVTKSGTGAGSVTSSPAGINCGATCSASFTSGTSVTLTATPTAGSTFGGFSGGCTSATTTCTFTITANATVTATFNDTQAPTAPSSLTATVASSTQINLTWTASTDNIGVTGYRVERCQGASCTNFAQIATPTGASFNNTGLTAGTTYRYRVRAADAAGNLSAYSNIVSATTTASDTTPPTISSVAAGSITSSGATITWTTNEASDTQVEYGTTTSYGNSTTLNTAMVTSHNATLSGLAASTLYHYRVKSRDAAGNLSTSGDFTFTTASAGGPDLNQLYVAIATITSSSITINDVVKNFGTVNAGAFDVSFYLSTDTTYQTTDTFLCKRSISGLAPNTSSPPSGTAATTCSLSSGIASESYYLLAVADSGQVVTETNETNNTYSTAALIGPDLIVSGINATKSSNTLTLQSAVKNQGNRDAGAFDLGFYLSTDTTLNTASDPFVCKRSIPSLAAGISDPPSSVTTTTCTLPAVPAGSYYVIGFADSTRVITEYNESNNTLIGGNITMP